MTTNCRPNRNNALRAGSPLSFAQSLLAPAVNAASAVREQLPAPLGAAVDAATGLFGQMTRAVGLELPGVGRPPRESPLEKHALLSAAAFQVMDEMNAIHAAAEGEGREISDAEATRLNDQMNGFILLKEALMLGASPEQALQHATREVPTLFDPKAIAAEARLQKPSTALLDQAAALARVLGRYHRHEVVGLENVPATGPCVLATNHSLATYDIALLANALRDEGPKRTMRFLGDHLIFQTPLLRDFATRMGLVEGRPDNARALLEQGELVGVAPGGQLEMLRPTPKGDVPPWQAHRGFAKLALNAQVPLVLAACPAADEIYDVPKGPNRLITQPIYHAFKAPVVYARGRGHSAGLGVVTPQTGLGFAVPRPKKLTHLLSEPIQPPPLPPDVRPGMEAYEKLVNDFHGQLIERMTALNREARALDTAK